MLNRAVHAMGEIRQAVVGGATTLNERSESQAVAVRVEEKELAVPQGMLTGALTVRTPAAVKVDHAHRAEG